MLTFSTMYHPLTSRPFLSNQTYTEYRPCKALSAYISCYWIMDGEKSGEIEKEVLVIPDTCMDIIIRINHTRQVITGYLCGMQDRPFISSQKESEDTVTCFAIRFHFWAASLFLNLNFKDICNGIVELEGLGREWELLFQPFFNITDAKQRIALVEVFLLKKIDNMEWNPNLFNSIHQILDNSGRIAVKDICEYSSVSQRQMERLFLREVGLPLKRIANLVRYQNVWRDMVRSQNFDIQRGVYCYGYTDQAHLLNEFKRFHGVTSEEARRIAYINR